MKPRVVVLGEKPQGAQWLTALLASGLFEIVAGVPRFGGQRWWDEETFRDILESHRIPIVHREELKNLDYDILWSLMYGFIIEAEHIARARRYGLNLHEAPLPRYRGCNGYTHAILESAETYGTTFHFLAPELDAGDIIDQEIFPIELDETSKELYVRTMGISQRVFERNLARVAANDLPRRPIDVSGEVIRPRSSLVELKEFRLSGRAGLEPLVRAARAFDFLPFEPAFFSVDGKKFYMFIDGSLKRATHAHEGLPSLSLHSEGELERESRRQEAFLVPSGARPLVVMEAALYASRYPIFFPKYSWALK
jgi:methionyl-tRNA formyltransferase